jgi:hypothetical protein
MYLYSRQYKIMYNTSKFCGAPTHQCATEGRYSMAHGLVRHRNPIFVAKILWRNARAPQNTHIGAPHMTLSLLVTSRSPELQRLAAGASKVGRRCCNPPSPELQRPDAGDASPPSSASAVLQDADVGTADVLQACRRARWRCCKTIDACAAIVLQVGHRDTNGGATRC